jgi:hypothetical protein
MCMGEGRGGGGAEALGYGLMILEERGESFGWERNLVCSHPVLVTHARLRFSLCSIPLTITARGCGCGIYLLSELVSHSTGA